MIESLNEVSKALGVSVVYSHRVRTPSWVWIRLLFLTRLGSKLATALRDASSPYSDSNSCQASSNINLSSLFVATSKPTDWAAERRDLQQQRYLDIETTRHHYLVKLVSTLENGPGSSDRQGGIFLLRGRQCQLKLSKAHPDLDVLSTLKKSLI